MQIYTISEKLDEDVFSELKDSLVYPCMIIKLFNNEIVYYTSKKDYSSLGYTKEIGDLKREVDSHKNALKQMFYAFGAVVPEAIGMNTVGIYQEKPVIYQNEGE